jgi:hypothetical protein
MVLFVLDRQNSLVVVPHKKAFDVLPFGQVHFDPYIHYVVNQDVCFDPIGNLDVLL